MDLLPSKDYKKLLEIIHITYSVPDRATMFQMVCEKLQRVVPFDGAAFIPLDPCTAHFSYRGHVVFNSPVKTLPLFCLYYAPLHPLVGGGFHTKRFNEAMRITDVLPASGLAKTEYSRDFQSLVPMFYELCAMACSQGDLIAGLCFHRTKRDRDFTDHDKKILSVLMPHLSLALHNINLIEAIALSQGMGLIILGEDGHPLYMNEEAKEALNGNPVEKMPDPGLGAGAMLFRTETRVYRIQTVQRLAKKSIILLEPLPTWDELKSKLSHFGLSRRQEEIAVLVMQGLSNHEISNRLCIAKQTVKDHIRDIFEKAKVHHRIELAAKVMRFRPEDQ
jgi:DNA-binding CsgD family transcriptional regulator